MSEKKITRTPISFWRLMGPSVEEGWKCHGCGGGTEPGDILFDYQNSIKEEGQEAEVGISLTVCFDCRQELVSILFREQVRMLQGKKMKDSANNALSIPEKNARIKKEEEVA